MSRAGGQQSADAAKRAADQLRAATNLLGGAQSQQASSKLDQLGAQADRLSKEESTQAERVRKLAAEGQTMQAKAQGAGGGLPSQQEMQAAQKERGSLANDRQQMSDDLSQREKGMRDTARELAPNQPGASSKLRDALSGMDQPDLPNLMQRTADWLRSGINPNSNGTETEIASGLKKLDDQVRQARQAAGMGGNGSRAQGTETAALDHVDRLRSMIEGMAGRSSPNGKPGQQQEQNGQAGQQGRGQQGQGQQAGQGVIRGRADGALRERVRVGSRAAISRVDECRLEAEAGAAWRRLASTRAGSSLTLRSGPRARRMGQIQRTRNARWSRDWVS